MQRTLKMISSQIHWKCKSTVLMMSTEFCYITKEEDFDEDSNEDSDDGFMPELIRNQNTDDDDENENGQERHTFINSNALIKWTQSYHQRNSRRSHKG